MSAKENAKIVAYKGFEKNWQCRGYQFEVGQTYKHDGKVEACNSGFHACEHPLDIFNYYAPANSVFARVELAGDLDRHDADSKIAAAEITIKAEITMPEIVEAAIKHVFDAAKWLKKSTATGDYGAASATGYQGAASATGPRGAASATGPRGAASATGYQGAASATGDYGAASATGYQGAASATGDYGAASATGYQGAAMATGIDGKVMGEVDGIDLFAREFIWDDSACEYIRKSIACGTTGENGIKAGVWYRCVDGKLVECV